MRGLFRLCLSGIGLGTGSGSGASWVWFGPPGRRGVWTAVCKHFGAGGGQLLKVLIATQERKWINDVSERLLGGE